MNIVDIKNNINNEIDNFRNNFENNIKNTKNFILKTIGKKNTNKISNSKKKFVKFTKNIDKYLFNKNITELEVKKIEFYKYLKYFVKKEKNYIPNKLYIYYNKSPSNILYSILFPYILYLLYANTNYIININNYWDEIENKYKNIKKLDPKFNPKNMYQSRKLYDTAEYRRIIYFVIILWTITISFIIYMILHYIMESMCNLIIEYNLTPY